MRPASLSLSNAARGPAVLLGPRSADWRRVAGERLTRRPCVSADPIRRPLNMEESDVDRFGRVLALVSLQRLLHVTHRGLAKALVRAAHVQPLSARSRAVLLRVV
jgi:hypothetical protein